MSVEISCFPQWCTLFPGNPRTVGQLKEQDNGNIRLAAENYTNVHPLGFDLTPPNLVPKNNPTYIVSYKKVLALAKREDIEVVDVVSIIADATKPMDHNIVFIGHKKGGGGILMKFPEV